MYVIIIRDNTSTSYIAAESRFKHSRVLANKRKCARETCHIKFHSDGTAEIVYLYSRFMA